MGVKTVVAFSFSPVDSPMVKLTSASEVSDEITEGAFTGNVDVHRPIRLHRRERTARSHQSDGGEDRE
jgi:hypothetical protein